MITLTVPQLEALARPLARPRGAQNQSILDKLETVDLPGKVSRNATTIIIYCREALAQYAQITAALDQALADTTIDQATHDSEVAELRAQSTQIDARALPYDLITQKYEIPPAVMADLLPILEGAPAPAGWIAYPNWQPPAGVNIPGYPAPEKNLL